MKAKAGLILLLVAGAGLTFYLYESPRDAATSSGDPALCAKEAVLLEAQQQVFPEIGAEPAVLLPAHTPVYLCERVGDHQRLLYPQAGTPADCFQRSSDSCPFGYIKLPFETIILG